MSKNHVAVLKKWSNLTEAITYFTKIELSRRKQVLVESLASIKISSIGDKLYSSDIIVPAYVSVSRALYKRIRNDYQLSSVSTLLKLTSKVSKLINDEFILHVFCKLTDQQQQSVLMVDKVMSKLINLPQWKNFCKNC